MERNGIVKRMTERLFNPREPNTITCPLAGLLRINLLLLGQGWRDQDDADRLRHDPSFRVANDSRGTAALEQERVLPSQPTMSRLFGRGLSGEANQTVVREAVSELALQAVSEQPAPPSQAAGGRLAGAGTRAAFRADSWEHARRVVLVGFGPQRDHRLGSRARLGRSGRRPACGSR